MSVAIAGWWQKLPESARSTLRDDPRQALGADLVVSITQARGVGPAWSQWEGQAPSPAHLLEAEAAWIEEHGGEKPPR